MIAEILASLPQQCRLYLLLQYIAGFSQREIASIKKTLGDLTEVVFSGIIYSTDVE